MINGQFIRIGGEKSRRSECKDCGLILTFAYAPENRQHLHDNPPLPISCPGCGGRDPDEDAK